MTSAKESGVVYVRFTDGEKELLDDVRKAIGVSQNSYARKVLLTALLSDYAKYADVIARQKELRDSEDAAS